MSDTTLIAFGILELVGLVGLFLYIRKEAERREAGRPRRPRAVRIGVALVGLCVLVGGVALPAVAMMNPTIQAERRHDELVQNGMQGSGTITHVQETGTVINYRPEVRVVVTVRPQEGPPFQSQETRVFSVADTQSYRVGTEVNVLYDPADRTTVALVGPIASAR